MLKAMGEPTTGEFFSEDEADRREATRTRLDRAAILIQERLRTDDVSIAERVKALGFDGETAQVFDLIPMVHVAWADGKIQRGERNSILAVLGARGIERGSEAFVLMESLLETKPPDSYLTETLAVLKDLMVNEPRRTEALVDFCYAVADAAGGFLGLGNPIDPKERELLLSISEQLGDRAELWVRARLGD